MLNVSSFKLFYQVIVYISLSMILFVSPLSLLSLSLSLSLSVCVCPPLPCCLLLIHLLPGPQCFHLCCAGNCWHQLKVVHHTQIAILTYIQTHTREREREKERKRENKYG